jgi:hypothetical protein
MIRIYNGQDDRRYDMPDQRFTPTIAAHAARVLDLTRRAWSAAPAQAAEAAPEPVREPKRGGRRAVSRRSQRANLFAALNYWSPRPL